MSDEIIRNMNIEEFRDFGFLQELNRQFLHPLGLALEAVVDENGNWTLGRVWDYRDDPEGIVFADEMIDPEKRERVEQLRKEKAESRKAALGFEIQEE